MTERKMNIVIEEEGLFLREIEYSDTDYILKWRNSEEVRRRFIDRREFTKESHENWLKNVVGAGRAKQYIICISPDENKEFPKEEYLPVGSVYVRDLSEEHHKGEYGIFIGEGSARGRGIGSRTAKLMVRHCFENLRLHRLYLRVFADNEGAIKSYENAGFVREGVLKDDVYEDGRYYDMVLMGIINPGK